MRKNDHIRYLEDEKNKCQKARYTDANTGEIFTGACGRRSCSRCGSHYAHILATAIETAHGLSTAHMVLTVNRHSINKFPLEKHYVSNKSWTRDLCRYGPIGTKNGFSPYPERIATHTQNCIEIQKGSERVYRGKRRIIQKISEHVNRNYRDIGHFASIEFGEKNGRFHVHLVIMRPFIDVITALTPPGEVPEWDRSRNIHILNIPEWPWGMIRLCGLSKPRRAIEYLTAYSTKSAPGRVTPDAKSSQFKKQARDAYAAIARSKSTTAKLEYTPIGKEERKKQSKKDSTYTILKQKSKEKRH